MVRASVVIPAFNASATLETCLLALCAQSLPRREFEIIVVDDGSSDATAQVAAGVEGVRLLRAPHRGAAAARNLGAREASGQVLLFTDADCEPTPDWIEAMLAPFESAESNVVGAKGTYRTRQREWIARFVQLEYEDKYAGMSRHRYIDFVDTYSAAYRRDVFLANCGFDEAFPSASVEDQEFSFRLARQGCRMVFLPHAVVYHCHAATLRAYLQRKFRIGYWKVRVHRRFPRQALRDSHTPFTLRLQVGLLLAAGPVLLAAPFTPLARLLALFLGAAFILSMTPLSVFIARRDRAAALIAPGMILARAAALSAGLVCGAWGQVLRSARLKRALDVCGALLGLTLGAPLWPVIALAIKLDSAGPVFFTQLRAGESGRPFRIYKFRSMVDGAEGMLEQVIARSNLPPPVFKIPNDPRVTRVGRFLRRYSLDELPQFVNVLKGDMSLVGPRPEELRIVALYGDWHRRRLAVKPGLTGPMQVNGRGRLGLDERVRLELDYVERQNLWEDLRLVARTLPALLTGRGAY